MFWNVKYYLSFILLVLFNIRPKKEYVQRMGKALSMREFNWIYEVFINLLEQDLLYYRQNNKISTEFLNEGNGKGTIQSYRKIKGENILLFEKIYFKDRFEWKKTIEFYDNIYSEAINSNIVIPKLLQVSKGEDLVVAYSEYLFLEPIERSEYFGKAIEMAARIANIPCSYNKTSFPEFSDYDQDVNFNLFKKRLLSSLSLNSDDKMIELIKRIDQYIKHNTVRILSHGDLCNNLFKNNTLIDWDRCGYYPVGYDFAMILIHTHQRDELSIDDYFTLENEFYSTIPALTSEDNFKMSLSYFTLVFLQYNPKRTKILRDLLLSEIKERYRSM